MRFYGGWDFWCCWRRWRAVSRPTGSRSRTAAFGRTTSWSCRAAPGTSAHGRRTGARPEWCAAGGTSCWRARWQPSARAAGRGIPIRPRGAPLEVVRRIARGDIFYYDAGGAGRPQHVRYRGSRWSNSAFSRRPNFLQAARNPAMIRDLDPEAPTLEGYLFPNTYRLATENDAGTTVPHDDEQVPGSPGGACIPTRTCIAW